MTNIFNKLYKKHRHLDTLIYTLSRKKTNINTIRFNLELFLKKIRYTSNLDPIFIGGCPRSGTTLARSLVGIHPKIASPKKEYYIFNWNKNRKYIKDIFGFSFKEIDDITKKNKDVISCTEKILRSYMEKKNKQLVLLKRPSYIIVSGKLFSFFPNMKFINIIRDGRDVACSLRTHPKRKIVDGNIIPTGIKNPFKWCIINWVISINQGFKIRRYKNYIEVKYEDLVKKPVNSMEKIYDFLGLEMIDKNILFDFYKHENYNDHIQNIEVGKPIYKNTIGRWKKDMNEKEKKIFKNMAGELLIKLGYEKDFDW